VFTSTYTIAPAAVPEPSFTLLGLRPPENILLNTTAGIGLLVASL
jgi:hypothetical protein